MLDNANSATFSVPGSFGDWDALITGGQGCLAATLGCQGPGSVHCGPEGGGNPGERCPNMTQHEYKSAFSIWVLGASPLMIDADIRNMSQFQRSVLLHSEVLEIHRDALGVGGSRICDQAPGCQGELWVKGLSGNQSAVALLNTAATPQLLCFSFGLLGYDHTTRLHVRDVWSREDLGLLASEFCTTATVPPHGTMLLRIKEAGVTVFTDTLTDTPL